jgi:predicted regulator of amino acid metabolism with ACT domain
MSPLVTVLATILTCFVALLIGGSVAAAIWFNYKRKQREVNASVQFCESVEKLSKVAESLSELPKLLSGHAKVAQGMVVEIAAFRKTVDQFSRLIVDPKTSSKDLLTVPTEEDADRHFSIAQILMDNPEMTTEEAALRADAEETLKGTYRMSME